MKNTILAALALGLSFFAQGQNTAYFQQKVDYRIQVKLDDKAHVIRGYEEFTYTNNSTEALDFIYIHLWPNAYKNKKTALAKQLIKMDNTKMYFATPDDLGFIDSLEFKVDGNAAKFEFDAENIDYGKLFLANPLKTGESITVSTPFKVKIPSGEISRLGHIDQSYQITQWYPKPAVFDTAGWHPMPYLTQGEFYSEFGSFDVEITVPKNYVVAATGDLQTEEEIVWLNEKIKQDSIWIYQREKKEDWTDYSSMDFPESSDTLKTIRFVQSQVHDFAWFADKRYHVLKGRVRLPASRKSVDVYTMFTNSEAELWSKSIEYMRDAIYYYSLWNGDYPYKHATAVDGTISAGGGMEYPNVTVIGGAGDAITLETVIMHEVGHNWFYGILGSNERRYAWLDEGINSYNEQRYLSTKYPTGTMLFKDDNAFAKLTDFNKYGLEDFQFFTYLFSARPNMDQPLNTHSAEYSNINYGAIVYAKSAVYLNYLRHSLGDSTMDASMHKYFEENKFKHPYPKSFENAFADVNQPTKWFFEDAVNTSKELDYKIKCARTKGDSTIVTIKNKGHIDGPVIVQFMNGHSVLDTKWVTGFSGKKKLTFQGSYRKVCIDKGGVMPEVNRQNNFSRTRGVFRKVEPIQFRFVGKVEQPNKSQLFFIPTLGWNSPSGMMLGLTFYNSLIPTKRFTYILSPMYGFGINKAMGALDVRYMIPTSKSRFESFELGIKGKSYAWYNSTLYGDIQFARVEPFLLMYIRPKDYSSLWRHHIQLSSVNVSEIMYRNSGVTTVTNPAMFNRIELESKWSHPIFRTELRARIEQNKDFLKSELTIKNTTRITEKLTLRSRAFAGAFAYNNSIDPRYNFRMDGQSATFNSDYAFDHVLLGRNGKTMFANQLTNTYGGFKMPTAVAQSNAWLTAVNFKLHYGKLPIGLFADFGISSNDFAYDAGAYLKLVDDVVECYFPLLYSGNIKKSIQANSLNYKDIIRFEFNLSELNLFQRARRLEI